MNAHSWREPATGAGRARRALAALATTAAAGALCTSATAPAAAAPHAARAAAVAPTDLVAVACPDAGDCFAVGNHTHPLGQPVTAIDQLSGGTWSAVASPMPSGATLAVLTGVACTSARNCLAVGRYATSPNHSFSLAQRWNGTAWSLLSIPDRAAGSALAGVACTSARNCWAVGSDGNGTLAEHWNGAAWAIVATPGGRGTGLAGVACASAAACWAVGRTGTGTLTLRWNGSAWAKVTTPTSKLRRSGLLGVSCASGARCLAVGFGARADLLAQGWNGSAWSVVARRSPGSTALTSTSCVSGPVCMSGGIQRIPPQQSSRTLAARWTGRTWVLLATPNPAGPKFNVHALQGVACTGAADCWAVGGSASTGEPGLGSRIIEHWNGTAWSLVH